MVNENAREFGWEDTIENDSTGFVLLEPGEYEFWVDSFERARYSGSSKLPPCNQAVVMIKIMSEDGQECTIKHNLFLHSKCEGLLCSFFTSIGMRKHGEPLKMNWPAIVGKYGRCKVGIREYIDKNGETRKANQIDRFLEPNEDAAGVNGNKSWTAGSF